MVSRKAARRSAFTLLEILIVVAIIVVVAGVGGYYLFGALESGKISASRAQMKVVEQALEAYRLANSVPPDNLEVLLMPDPANDNLPYLKEAKNIRDAWGNIFSYEYTDRMGPTLGFRTPGGTMILNKEDLNNPVGP